MLSFGSLTTNLTNCPYLGDRPSQTWMRYIAKLRPEEHESLLGQGMRHFGHLYFKPACPQCTRCESLRVLVQDFKLSRSQRRTLARNKDIQVDVLRPSFDESRMDLYRRFHKNREAARGWAPSEKTPEEFYQTFVESPTVTHEISYKLAGELVALAYIDETPNAFSSIYGIWDPACSRRGLGTFDVLTEILLARQLGKDHLYLGYHVAGCQSLEYKTSFRPYEILKNGCWRSPDEASYPFEAVGRA